MTERMFADGTNPITGRAVDESLPAR